MRSARSLRYAAGMEDESKKKVSESLRDWGIDVGRFEERAKESIESARGDLSEVTGTLRHTLVEAKDVLLGLQKGGAPAAAELKSGFERAWQEIERAFTAARQKAREARPSVAEAGESAESDPKPVRETPSEPVDS
jgi:hypothetical protein